MKIDVTTIGSFLRITACVTDPELNIAVDPDSIEVSFFVVDPTTGAVTAHALGTVAMTKVGTGVGYFGVSVDVSAQDMANTVAVIRSVVNEKELLEEINIGSVSAGGGSVVAVGAPQITFDTTLSNANLVEM